MRRKLELKWARFGGLGPGVTPCLQTLSRCGAQLSHGACGTRGAPHHCGPGFSRSGCVFDVPQEKAMQTMQKKDQKLAEIDAVLKEEIQPAVEKVRGGQAQPSRRVPHGLRTAHSHLLRGICFGTPAAQTLPATPPLHSSRSSAPSTTSGRTSAPSASGSSASWWPTTTRSADA